MFHSGFAAHSISLERQMVNLRAQSIKRKDALEAYIMVLPAVVLLSIFVVVPILYAFKISLYDLNYYAKSAFVGMRNYYLVLTDPLFKTSLFAGFKFVLYVIPGQFLLSFLVANVVKRMSRAGGFVKSSIYIPTVISGIVAGLIFMFIYDFQGGFGNYLLGLFGVEPLAWYNDTRTAMLSIALPAIWLGFGVMTLIMLAGLNDIPVEYYEAANMDGAGGWTKMFRITIPSLRNVFVYLLVTSVTSAFQVFDLPFLITQGGPLGLTTTPNLLIFNHFRSDPYMGYAIAAALVMFILLGLLSVIIFKVINSEKAMD